MNVTVQMHLGIAKIFVKYIFFKKLFVITLPVTTTILVHPQTLEILACTCADCICCNCYNFA